MRPHVYRFRDRWFVRARPESVFKALVAVDDYPLWWRDIRAVRRIDENSGQARCRSVLPYALDLSLRRAVEEPDSGRLRVDIGGDLEGYCAAVVTGAGDGTLVRIAQEVVLRKAALRRIEPLLRPLLRANHAAMMWRGERGMRAHLI